MEALELTALIRDSRSGSNLKGAGSKCRKTSKEHGIGSSAERHLGNRVWLICKTVTLQQCLRIIIESRDLKCLQVPTLFLFQDESDWLAEIPAGDLIRTLRR